MLKLHIRWNMINNKNVCFDYVIIDIIIYVEKFLYMYFSVSTLSKRVKSVFL